MFNKLKFNNLVISNKKGIQLSRAQTINKLVHKIRKLKSLLQKHPDNMKCKERIRKSTETMQLLKKLGIMDVMKKLLLLDKPATAVTNGIATPEELAIALLSMNKVMQGLIKRFKTELQVNEIDNDDWKFIMMESSKRKQKIERTEEKRRKRLHLKHQKAIERKRQEWLKENQHNAEGESISGVTECNLSTTEGWKMEELPNDVYKNKIKSDKESRCSIEEKPFTKKIIVTNIKQKTEDLKLLKNFDKKKESENKLIITKENSNISDIDQNENFKNATDDCADSLVVDPFFITDTGENYMSSAIIKRDDFTGKEKSDLHMVKLYNNNVKNPKIRNENRKYINHQNANNWNSEREHRHFIQNKRSDKSIQMKHQGSKYKKSENSSSEKSLHPSWQAKQKLKPIITKFQGKKITFEDDVKPEKLQVIDNKIRKSTTPKSNKSDDSIHPSWAAKLKLKPSITAFQGKKITFDDDE